MKRLSYIQDARCLKVKPVSLNTTISSLFTARCCGSNSLAISWHYVLRFSFHELIMVICHFLNELLITIRNGSKNVRNYVFFTPQPPVGQGLLIHEVSRSHTTTHSSQYDSFGRVISSSQRPLPDNTQHSQQTDIHGPPVGFEPTKSAGKRPQYYALDRVASGTGKRLCTTYVLVFSFECHINNPWQTDGLHSVIPRTSNIPRGSSHYFHKISGR